VTFVTQETVTWVRVATPPSYDLPALVTNEHGTVDIFGAVMSFASPGGYDQVCTSNCW